MRAVITFGLPAAGKSTWAKKHYSENQIVSADEIKKSLPGYNDKNHEEFYQQSVKVAKTKILYLAHIRADLIVFDTGSINKNYSKEIFEELQRSGYKITLVVFTASSDTCIKRNKGRDQEVPEKVIIEKEKIAPQALWNLLPFVNDILIVKD